MASWLNHVTIAAPRNATTTHTLTPSSGTAVSGALFTPTAGNLLVVVVEGSVTSSTPSGWTLPSGGSAVNNSGLYVWWRTAAGADSLSTTHNGSNYPVVFDFYEFAAGSTFVAAASLVGVSSGAANPGLTGLTGTNHHMFTTAVGTGSTSAISMTWTGATELVDTYTAATTTDGYGYGLAYVADSAAASTAPAAATIVNGPASGERITFAVKIAAIAGTTYAITGSAASTSATVCALTSARTLAGAATSSSSTTGAVVGQAVIVATAASTSSTTGSVGLGAGIAGAATSTSSTTAAVALTTGPQTYSVTGAAASTSSTTASVATAGQLTGQAQSISSTTGSVTVAANSLSIAGSAASNSVAAAAITGSGSLAGAAQSSSAAAFTVTVTAVVAGQAISISTTAGAVNNPRSFTLAGAALSVSVAVGSLVIGGQVRDITFTVSGPDGHPLVLGGLRGHPALIAGPHANPLGLDGPR